MKVKDLKEKIWEYEMEYGDISDWDIFAEQVSGYDRKAKKANKQWRWLKDSEGWEYLECAGGCTLFRNDKAISVNVNY